MQNLQIRPASAKEKQRRLRLRVAAKAMLYIGMASIVYVFLSAIMSGDGEVPAVPSLRVDISDIQPGEVDFLTWAGRPVLVYRRTDADIVNLRSDNTSLRDPTSARSDQPEFASNALRASEPEFFIAIALGTGQGCTVELLPASDEQFQGKPWQGGFMDSCGKDRYDLAGRVYDKQYARENLRVPQYGIDGQTLILGR